MSEHGYQMNDSERRILENRHAGKGQHTYKYCDVCGYLDWVSSKPDGEPAHVHAYPSSQHIGSGGNYCAQCTEASERAPELADWTVNVVLMQTRKMREELEALREKVDVLERLQPDDPP